MKRTVFASATRFEQLGLHHLARLCVQRGEGLVHQQDGRVDGQRAGEVRPLLHAAGELVRVVLLEAAQPDHLDQWLARRLASARGDLAALEAVADVPGHREPGEQRRVLEDHRPVAAVLGRRPAVDEDSPAVGSSRPSTIFRKVVLPQPLGPTMLTNSPGWIVSVTSSIARTQVPSRRSYSISTWVAWSSATALLPRAYPARLLSCGHAEPTFGCQALKRFSIELTARNATSARR